MRRRPLMYLMLAILVLVAAGCAQQAEAPDDLEGEWITITGTIMDATDDTYLVVATETTTGQTFTTDTRSGGSFSLRVPEGASYVLGLIDEAGMPAGVLAFQDTARNVSRDLPSSTATTGFKALEDCALGVIDVPESAGKVEVVLTDSALIDTAVMARTDGIGELLGFGTEAKSGKGSSTLLGSYDGGTGGKADKDGDGLPAVFDADDDGDGIPDDLDKDADGDGIEDSSTLASRLPVEFTLGYLLDIRQNDGVRSYASDVTKTEALRRDMRLDFRIRFASDALFNDVRQIRLYTPSSPAYAVHLDAVEFDPDGGGWATYTLADGTSFTPTGSSIGWANLTDTVSGDGYNIPKSRRDARTFSVSTKIPVERTELFAVGDIFTIEIIYADGSIGMYSSMINFIFDTVSHFEGYDITETMTPTMNLSSYTPFDFAADVPHAVTFPAADDDGLPEYLHFAFIPPKDDMGAYIIGDGTVGSDRYGSTEFRIELHKDPDMVTPDMLASDVSVSGWNSEHTYFSTFDEILRIVSGSDIHGLGTVPLDYLKQITGTDASSLRVETFEMEYFLSVSPNSYVKNRLTFERR